MLRHVSMVSSIFFKNLHILNNDKKLQWQNMHKMFLIKSVNVKTSCSIALCNIEVEFEGDTDEVAPSVNGELFMGLWSIERIKNN